MRLSIGDRQVGQVGVGIQGVSGSPWHRRMPRAWARRRAAGAVLRAALAAVAASLVVVLETPRDARHVERGL
jgi:hypothetical protein